MDSKDTLYYADCLVLFIDMPMYGEWEGRSWTFWRLKLLYCTVIWRVILFIYLFIFYFRYRTAG